MRLILHAILASFALVSSWTVRSIPKNFLAPRFCQQILSATSDATSEALDSSPERTFLLGTGFLQFVVSNDLIKTGTSTPVLMTDVAKSEGVRSNWCPPPAVVVTNGEGEWEAEASKCTALVVCPEASDIPGKTISALLSKMPLCRRVVVVSPAGTTTGEPVGEKEDNWLFNRMMILGGKRVGAAGDKLDYARAVEEAAREAERDGVVRESVVVHRGMMKGGGGEDGLGEKYYKVCGSEPEEILERTYDSARKGCIVIPGDGIDVTPKSIVKGEGDDVAMKNLKEELKNKTSRLSLSAAIVGALRMENPPREFSVLCDLKEERDGVMVVTEMLEGMMAKGTVQKK
ncbi:hypothetical protein TrRE_jg3492 [Triparma retinervis]|uniref:Uncharacterized protein n=1 Tax=Triparma retinervis TaxID=2557542 RepID=A0A9W7F8U0_9STRA|nr:hypothetical protein TrRE_jg3492 [Triparma retinervis]